MKTKPILVTGANGFVGYPLCVELVKLGYPVRAALRSTGDFDIPSCEKIKISNVDSHTEWTQALHGIDTVLHLAARVHVMHDDACDPLEEFRRVNLAGTEHLARSAAKNGVRRLVYVRSIKVNGEGTIGDKKYTEVDEPSPKDPYGVSKWEAEQALYRVSRETGLEVVIVRPPLVYGAGVKGNFAQMLRVLAKGIPLPLGSVRNLRSLVYVGNLVNALILCAAHPAAAGQIYLVSDGEDISTPDLLQQLARAMGSSANLFTFPALLLRLSGSLIGKSDQMDRLLGSLRVDSAKIRRELDWHQPYTLGEGLQHTGVSVHHNGNIR